MRLKNQVAVVTGGARGLGAEMCRLFAKEGAKVIAVDMGEMTYQAEGVEFYRLNITDPTACRAFYEETMSKYEQIDILVNNAGITRDAMTRKMSDELWDLVIDVDLKGLFNLTRYIGPQMEDKGSGAIVNISSVVGEYGNIGQAIMPRPRLVSSASRKHGRRNLPGRARPCGSTASLPDTP